MTGLPPPCANPDLLGHEAAQIEFLAAFSSGRLHHGWLITGPKGIGKATLAFRLARRLLGGKDHPDDPVFRLVAAASHPDMRVIKLGVNEKTGKPRGEIPVDDIRGLHGFLATTASMDGWRVVIVDDADAMNRNAANALLKLLEEPPARTLLFLTAHMPGRLLPTIRSRCRSLRLGALDEASMTALLRQALPESGTFEREALIDLAEGSIGTALALGETDGAAVHAQLRAIFIGLPGFDAKAVHIFAGGLGGRNEGRFSTFTLFFRRLVEDSIRAASGGAPLDQAPWAALASLDRWLLLWDKAAHLIDRANAVRLDPTQVALALFEELRNTIAR